jgi:transposase
MPPVKSTGSNGRLTALPFAQAELLLGREKKTGRDQGEPADHALGRSRGGFGTKIHLLVDGHGIPLAADVTAGQVHESTQLEAVVSQVAIKRPTGRLRRHPQRLAGDKAYHARRIRRWLRRRGIQPVIPPSTRSQPRRKRGRPVGYNQEQYRQRNVVERCVGWLKECRSLATRFEKLALNYLSMVKLAMIERYLRLLTA